MNTFLPFPNLRASAMAIDPKRLNKQVMECKHLATALMGETKGYAFHPATLMWEGHLPALIDYARWCCYAFSIRNKKTHQYEAWFNEQKASIERARTVKERKKRPGPVMPWWFGNKTFHASNRGILLWKNPAWYQKQFRGMKVPKVKPDYVWPVGRARWKIGGKHLLILRSKWSDTGCTVRVPQLISSRKMVGENTAVYLLERR